MRITVTWTIRPWKADHYLSLTMDENEDEYEDDHYLSLTMDEYEDEYVRMNKRMNKYDDEDYNGNT